MSLIQTCLNMKVDPFKYLVTLMKNASAVFRNPAAWLPWNYEQALT
jgi:hypothetical protein